METGLMAKKLALQAPRRNPAEEFPGPLGLSAGALAEAWSVPRTRDR
jgi:hypothetical protein